MDLTTPEGRREAFNKRIDELTTPKWPDGRKLTTDQALFEMRTGGNADDKVLLEAMGETVSHQRTVQLKEEKMKIAPEVAKASKARRAAFNARITELTGKGLSIDQAINAMRVNPADSVMLASMGAPK